MTTNTINGPLDVWSSFFNPQPSVMKEGPRTTASRIKAYRAAKDVFAIEVATTRCTDPKLSPQDLPMSRKKGDQSLDISNKIQPEGKSVNKMTSGQGIFHFPNGDRCEGDWVNGKMQGQGTKIWADGSRYVGGWMNNMRHGQGITIFDNGNKCVGYWSHGKMCGQGKYDWASGISYEGDFADGMPHGQGTKIWADGSRYVGNFVDGKRHGQGTSYDSNGKIEFSGNFVDSKRHGQGTLYGPNEKIVYSGNFVDDKMYGQGTSYDSNGKIEFSGNFVDGKMNNQGTTIWADGSRYVGGWQNSKMHGLGTLYDSNGKIVNSGNFVDGKMHGQGIFHFPNGDRYEGDFADDMPHGQGTTIWADGSRYVGGWQNSKMHGQGTLYDSNGKILYSGNFVDSKRHGQGIFHFPNGDRGEGYWANDKRNGHGTHYFANGGSLEGMWKNGLMIASIADIKQPKFFELLLGDSNSTGINPVFALGIISDFLVQNGYETVGLALTWAYQMLLSDDLLTEVGKQKKALEIFNSICSGNNQLLLYRTIDHAMGLKLSTSSCKNYVYCDIFNSGCGLVEYHKQSNNKFQTKLRFRVPKENFSPQHIRQFLDQPLASIDKAYNLVRHIPGAEEIQEENPVWQTQQKGLNCSLEWIFAFLKNSMPYLEYHEMREKLFTLCRDKATKITWPDEELKTQRIQALDKKILKRQSKLQSA